MPDRRYGGGLFYQAATGREDPEVPEVGDEPTGLDGVIKTIICYIFTFQEYMKPRHRGIVQQECVGWTSLKRASLCGVPSKKPSQSEWIDHMASEMTWNRLIIGW